MPARALGYFASGVMLLQDHFPEAQLQIVHPIHTAARVNGASLGVSRTQAEKFNTASRRLMEMRYPACVERVLFATDSEHVPHIDEAHVLEIIQNMPSKGASKKLARAAEDRNTEYAPYVIAHLAMHDTSGNLEVFDSSQQPKAIEPETIISIGAQSERPFYAARMACRAAGVHIENQVNTGQLFTKHVLPPYLQCREGEPPIEDATTLFLSEIQHAVPSVERDLIYTQRQAGGMYV